MFPVMSHCERIQVTITTLTVVVMLKSHMNEGHTKIEWAVFIQNFINYSHMHNFYKHLKYQKTADKHIITVRQRLDIVPYQ